MNTCYLDILFNDLIDEIDDIEMDLLLKLNK